MKAAAAARSELPAWHRGLLRGVHHRHGAVRKASRLLLVGCRAIARRADSQAAFRTRPPALANSMPKSGTHLLEQLVDALPGRRNFGVFLESMTASYVFRERSEASALAEIGAFLSGETIRAHLHHAPAVACRLREEGILHYFVYRDLRDVVISEAHYLRSVVWWHRLHASFRGCASFSEALLLAIRGLPRNESPYRYPDVGSRFRRFLPWLDGDDVCAVRYEDLRSERCRTTLERMARYFVERVGEAPPLETLVAAMHGAIAPGLSHTFRRGDSGAWREVFTPRHEAAFEEVAGDLQRELDQRANDSQR